MLLEKLREGYYWARHPDGTAFVVLFDEGLWYAPGIGAPINDTFDQDQIIKPLDRPDH